MPSINLIRASDGTGDATVATFTAPRTQSSTTCQVDSVAGYPQEFIATCGTPNVDTGIIESNIQVFVGHLSGSDIVIDVFAPGYSDMGNQVGDIIVIKPTTRTQDEIADILNVSHNDDGTLKADSVGTVQIVDQAVSAAKIVAGAVDTAQLADGAVTAPKTDFGGDYSTSEVNTGFKWVDGRTIYKKTINFGALPNATTKNVAHGISNLDTVIAIDGMAKSGSTHVPVNHAAVLSADVISCYATSTGVVIAAGGNRTAYSAYVTLWYTKSA